MTPRFHENILLPEQRELFRLLGPFASERGYYLAGGTAVALRLGHRKSIDFDWFAESPSVLPSNIEHDLVAAGLEYTVQARSSALVDGRIAGIRTTFVHYRYVSLMPADSFSEYDCPVASMIDLACMKLAAIAQRGSRKDFIDAYSIFNGVLSLGDMMPLYKQKFRVASAMPVLIGLTYFDDAESEAMPEMLIKLDWAKLKRFFVGAVRKLRP